jgi:hypothetical protein
VKEQDEAFENRGTTALVYDHTYVRHWDTWTGPKKSTLWSVGLGKTGSDGKWALQEEYIAPLKGSGHVSITLCWKHAGLRLRLGYSRRALWWN